MRVQHLLLRTPRRPPTRTSTIRRHRLFEDDVHGTDIFQPIQPHQQRHRILNLPTPTTRLVILHTPPPRQAHIHPTLLPRLLIMHLLALDRISARRPVERALLLVKRQLGHDTHELVNVGRAAAGVGGGRDVEIHNLGDWSAREAVRGWMRGYGGMVDDGGAGEEGL